MKNPKKAFETGEILLNEANPDMASLYFENAGENFIEAGNKDSAIKAYERALDCFLLLEKNDLIQKTQAMLKQLRA